MSDVLRTMSEMAQKERQKKNKNKRGKNDRKKGYNNYNDGDRMPLKKLLKVKKAKKTKPNEYAELLASNMDNILNELRRFYKQDGTKIFEDIEAIADLFTTKKFAKPLNMVLKEMEPKEIPDEILFVISDLYLSTNALNNDEAVCEKYLKLYAKRYKKQLNKVFKLLGVSGKEKMEVLGLFLTAQTYKGCKKNIERIRIYKFLRKFYEICAGKDLKEKDIKKILKIIFPHNMFFFIQCVLLERNNNLNNMSKEEKEVWSAVTNVALDMLEKMDDDERKRLLKFYADSRMKSNNGANVKARVGFNNISEKDYKKTLKTVKRLLNNSKISNWVFE